MTLTTTHIDELLDQCRRGDERAQMKVYKKYSRAMYNVALRIVKDSAEAEDIMQECFLKALTNWILLKELPLLEPGLKGSL